MRKTSYFISDLHLSKKDDAISGRFNSFIGNIIDDAERLYILGDLFEYWIGDDGVSVVGMEAVIEQLKFVTDNGIEGYFIAGNRDFLVGDDFSQMTGFKVLPDFSLIDLYGKKTLILHGDALCTDDVVHQEFRQNIMLNKQWHEQVLNTSLEERIALANQIRSNSNSHKMTLSDEIMDVNELTVVEKFQEYDVQQIIHGHTHRPKLHQHNKNCQRAVLGDWYSQTSYIRVSNNELELCSE